MRYDDRKAFPYPVLCPYNEDYSEGRFETQLIYELDKKGSDVRLELEHNLTQPLIKDYLASGKAQYTVIVNSRDTYFRDVLLGTNAKETLVYKRGELRGSIVVSSFITATEDIPKHKSPDFNKEFGNDGFPIKAGDVLALDEEKQFYVGVEPFQEIGTIWKLAANENIEMGSFDIRLDGESIEILLHPNQKQLLDSAKRQRDGQALIANSILLPGLMQVIREMCDPDHGYENHKWYQVMHGQCAKHDVRTDDDSLDYLKAAQKLLELPLKDLNKRPFFGRN